MKCGAFGLRIRTTCASASLLRHSSMTTKAEKLQRRAGGEGGWRNTQPSRRSQAQTCLNPDLSGVRTCLGADRSAE